MIYLLINSFAVSDTRTESKRGKGPGGRKERGKKGEKVINK